MCFRNGAFQTVARRKFPQGIGTSYTGLLALSGAFAAAFLAGCSGGSSSGTPGNSNPTPTPSASATPITSATATASIFWGSRTRAFSATSSGYTTAPSSALSATLTLTPISTASGATVLTASANRDTTRLAGYTSDPIPLGTAIVGQTYMLHVNFYAQANGAGAVVATADSVTTTGGIVSAGGTLSILVTTTGRIQSVKVLGVGAASALSSTLTVGQSADVLYSAYDGPDGTGNLIAVTPGSEVVNIAPGVSTIAVGANDQVRGVSPTLAANLTVSVDTVESPAFTLKVASTGLSIALVPTLLSAPGAGTVIAPVASPGVDLPFTATVTGDPTNSGVVFSLSSTALGTLRSLTTATAKTQTIFTPLATDTTGTVTLTATSNYDPNITVSVPIKIASLVSISVNTSAAGVVTGIPAGATFATSINTTTQFNATVNFLPSGADDTVTWSALFGTIDQNGSYTAPAAPGTDQITVTSNFDPTKKFVFNTYVQAGNLPITVN